MREILFRALDRNDNRWFELDINELAEGESSSWCDVDMDTISQSLDMEDQKGNQIWEGSLVLYFGSVYEIKYFKNGFYINDGLNTNFSSEEVLVVGDIFKNPELLQIKGNL